MYDRLKRRVLLGCCVAVAILLLFFAMRRGAGPQEVATAMDGQDAHPESGGPITAGGPGVVGTSSPSPSGTPTSSHGPTTKFVEIDMMVAQAMGEFTTGLACRLEPPPADGTPARYGAERSPEWMGVDGGHIAGPATIRDGEVYLPVFARAGRAAVHIEGYEPAWVSWSDATSDLDATCGPIAISAGATELSGTVSVPDGSPFDGGVYVCGQSVDVTQGRFSASPVRGDCSVFAYGRYKGWLVASGEIVVRVGSAQTDDIELVLEPKFFGRNGYRFQYVDNEVVLIAAPVDINPLLLVKDDVVVAAGDAQLRGLPWSDIADALAKIGI